MALSYPEFDHITSRILASAFAVHTALGPGLLEHAYKECLYHKITKVGLFVEKEKAMPVIFEEIKLDCGYRIDLLVENKIVLELKSVESLHDVHTSQVLTYMRLGQFKIGYLINFNVSSLKNGIKRFVL
jgi:GxxExxY protein